MSSLLLRPREGAGSRMVQARKAAGRGRPGRWPQWERRGRPSRGASAIGRALPGGSPTGSASRRLAGRPRSPQAAGVPPLCANRRRIPRIKQHLTRAARAVRVPQPHFPHGYAKGVAYALYVLEVLYVTAAISRVAMIGKPRKPVTRGDAIASVVYCAITATILVFAAMRLGVDP